MTITEDASTPTPVSASGVGPSITTGSFTPPAGSVMLAMVSGEWSAQPCVITLTDTAGGLWQLGSQAIGPASDGGFTAGGIAATYFQIVTTAPTSPIAVTASFTHLGGGMLLDVRVLDGADPGQTVATGWSAVSSGSSTGSAHISMTTTAAGSVTYGISVAPVAAVTFTPNGATTALLGQDDTADTTAADTWKALTGSPGSITLGGSWSSSTYGLVAAFEVVPSGTSAGAPPTMPTFVDGTVPTAADLNSIGLNIQRLYSLTTGGQRYQPYQPNSKGPIKPLTILSVTNPAFLIPTGGGSGTFILWDTVVANSDNAWSPLDAALILPQTSGLYRMHFQLDLALANTAPTDIVAIILINGTVFSTNGIAFTNTFGTSIGCSATAEITKFSEIYCICEQGSGNSVGVGLMQFAMEYLGP